MAEITFTLMPASSSRGSCLHQVHRGTGPLHDHVAVPRLPGREIANHVQAFGRGFQIRVGELLRSATGKSGRATSMRDDAHFRIARGDFGGGEIARGHVVVIPEIQMNGLAAREQLPDLRWRKCRSACGRRPPSPGPNGRQECAARPCGICCPDSAGSRRAPAYTSAA